MLLWKEAAEIGREMHQKFGHLDRMISYDMTSQAISCCLATPDSLEAVREITSFPVSKVDCLLRRVGMFGIDCMSEMRRCPKHA